MQITKAALSSCFYAESLAEKKPTAIFDKYIRIIVDTASHRMLWVIETKDYQSVICVKDGITASASDAMDIAVESAKFFAMIHAITDETAIFEVSASSLLISDSHVSLALPTVAVDELPEIRADAPSESLRWFTGDDLRRAGKLPAFSADDQSVYSNVFIEQGADSGCFIATDRSNVAFESIVSAGGTAAIKASLPKNFIAAIGRLGLDSDGLRTSMGMAEDNATLFFSWASETGKNGHISARVDSRHLPDISSIRNGTTEHQAKTATKGFLDAIRLYSRLEDTDNVTLSIGGGLISISEGSFHISIPFEGEVETPFSVDVMASKLAAALACLDGETVLLGADDSKPYIRLLSGNEDIVVGKVRRF